MTSEWLMMSAFCHIQHTLNRLFNNCRNLYWHKISSSWNMKGEGGRSGVKLPPSPVKTILKKSSLTRVNSLKVLVEVSFLFTMINKLNTDQAFIQIKRLEKLQHIDSAQRSETDGPSEWRTSRYTWIYIEKLRISYLLAMLFIILFSIAADILTNTGNK